MKTHKWVQSVTMLALCVGFVLSLPASGKKETIGTTPKTESGKPIVVVSIIPQAYFVKRIGGDAVYTLILVGPGQSPHTYEPTPRQMEELSKAKVWILSGTDFEDRIKPKVVSLYPSLSIIDGTQGITFRSLEAHDPEHGKEGKDEQKGEFTQEKKDATGPRSSQNVSPELGRDRHTWLGREPAKILAAHVRDALIKLIPSRAEEFKRNHDRLVAEIDSLFEGLKKDLASLNGKPVYVYHPAFGYFLDEFGIVQEAVETGGKEPNPQALATLIQKAKTDKVKVIFVQAQFPTQAVQTLAKELNAQVVALDPLAEDWLENIRRMGEALVKAVR